MLLEWFFVLLLATMIASALGYGGVAASMALFAKIVLLVAAVIGLGVAGAVLVQNIHARRHRPHGAV